MPWFDAGVNLLDKRFDTDKVLDEALAAGVDKLCVVTTCANEWDAAMALHQRYPTHIVYTLGFHPHNAKDAQDSDWHRLVELINEPGMVSIGECGLDFNRNFSAPDIQIHVFLRQLTIAKQYKLPVYLHERDAFSQQFTCLTDVFGSEQIAGITHCFTGTSEQMQAYLDLGLYIGITGWLCDPKRGESLRHSIKLLPNDRLIFETDAPYLFPKHVRPRKSTNEPKYLPEIANYYSEITQQEVNMLEQMSYTNSKRLFGM